MLKSNILKSNTFLYFAYGTNTWTFRMRMVNPSAEFVSIARLDDYRMDFIRYSKFWGGPVATPVPTANAHMWGVIWRVDMKDTLALDHEKGVDVKRCYIKYVEVHTPYIGSFYCRAYMQKIIPLPRGDNDDIPVERWPSETYKKVLILGAIEHEMPEYHIINLMKLKHNNEEGCLRMVCLLRRYVTLPCCGFRAPERIPRKTLKLDLIKLRKEKLKSE